MFIVCVCNSWHAHVHMPSMIAQAKHTRARMFCFCVLCFSGGAEGHRHLLCFCVLERARACHARLHLRGETEQPRKVPWSVGACKLYLIPYQQETQSPGAEGHLDRIMVPSMLLSYAPQGSFAPVHEESACCVALL